MSDQHLRLSDADREQAAADLAEHYAQGRLDADEHAERLDQIWAARTRGELAPIFRDLPGGRVEPVSRGLPTPLFVGLAVVLVILLIVTILTHLPVILLGLLVSFFFMARHRNRQQLLRR